MTVAPSLSIGSSLVLCDNNDNVHASVLFLCKLYTYLF